MNALTEKARLGAVDTAVTLSLAGMGGIAIQATETFSGTLAFEASLDNVNFRPLLVTPSNSATQVSSATAVGVWFANVTGLLVVRVRMSAYTSGTAFVQLKAVMSSPASPPGAGSSGGTSSNFGDAFPAAGTAAGFVNGSGNMAGGLVDAQGHLQVDILSGGGSNASVGATAAAVPASATFVGVSSAAGALTGLAAVALDLNSTTPPVVPVHGFYHALPGAGGPVAGGTTTNPIQVGDAGGSLTVDGTVTANIGTVGTLATAAKQDTGNTSLASIDGKITAVNTGAVVVSSSALPAGASTAARQDTGNTSLASIDGKLAALGQAAMAASVPVVIASNQTAVPVSVASVPLPTGASTLAEQQTQTTALAAIQTATQILDDWDESDRAKVNPIVGQAGVAAGAGAVGVTVQRTTLASDDPAVVALQVLDNIVSGSEAQVDIVAALPAGTNAIGKLAANSGVDIGDVDVTSLPALAAGTALIGKVSASDETNTIYDGTTALTPKFAIIQEASSGNNAVVAAVGGKKIRVLAYNFIANGTVNAKFQSDGAGTPADLTGLKYCVANMGICAPYNPVGWFESASGKSLDLNLSAAIAVGGELVYIEV